MARVIAGVIFLFSVWMFVRHQYVSVMQQVTTRSTKTAFPMSSRPAESRVKCVICGGTGRSNFPTFGTGKSAASQSCRSCRGMGWVDNPTYRR